ncbi:MAG: 1-(5-phosphoribosyl)-5-[(5-phosphoribosylamino)methylideneamino]imidazole-4-carboxamide isomerase [Myxococcales bacterium]|nr:1-(5-phosphoribosyl)-5-[(5-phosphoribosylamino)methylideneamino]imidazole-4-carboxamide isomerase [Myxococcales bacterium]MCB9750351.1 1-(5-phosphoribosyl)-5-[(5-phosphoribosylamino)methylideneamino]imidazole-4-carboxamide isomerase [Myxococcales bacterium]
MIAIPAIDLLEGKAVRLAEGDRARATVYERDPRVLVTRFADAGARWLHVVDLDGAFAGRPCQLELVRELVASAHARGVKVEVGGGLRSRAAITQLLEQTGADRAVVGTLAVREPEVVAALCQQYPERLVIAVDGRDDRVAVAGWQETSETTIQALAAAAQRWGAAALLYTDVPRDGLQGGPAVDATAALQRTVEIPVIASGGVGSLADLDALRGAGVRAVVLGRALYEGSFTLKEALSRC